MQVTTAVNENCNKGSTCPQFFLSESLAIRKLYQGILDATWWGTCTLMSCVRNSTLQHHKSCITHAASQPNGSAHVTTLTTPHAASWQIVKSGSSQSRHKSGMLMQLFGLSSARVLGTTQAVRSSQSPDSTSQEAASAVKQRITITRLTGGMCTDACSTLVLKLSTLLHMSTKSVTNISHYHAWESDLPCLVITTEECCVSASAKHV